MKTFMKYAKNSRGVTIVMIAFFLFLLLAFLGLAVDIAYMYFAKNQLQVAADAAALAGAANLDATSDTVQPIARTAAQTFAQQNKAAGDPVILANDNSNTLSDNNDITVGNWNPSLTPQYLAGRTPVNALEARPQRVGQLFGTTRGPIRTFIGKVFGWKFMDARSIAVATMPPRASAYLTMCELACFEGGTSCKYPNPECQLTTPRILSRDPGAPYDVAFAWTSLLNNVTSTTEVQSLICETTPYVDVCNHLIYTTQGESRTFKDLESVMFDRSIDTAAKDCRSGAGAVGNCVNVIGDVVGWTVIIPIATSTYCPPAAQPTPLQIYGYAKIHLTAVCGTGSGTACRSGNAPSSTCAPCGGSSAGGKCLIIDRIQCISCADYNNMRGLKPVLVK